MAPSSLLTAPLLAGVLLLAGQARAHGIATAIVDFAGTSTSGGTFYKGYNPSYQYENPPPVVVGWSTPKDLQNGFISPSQYGTADAICHVGATPAGVHAPVNAGDTIEIQWTPWPASHKGPVLDYLANCNGPCTTVDKTKLKFFKISEVGLVNAASDTWGATQLIANNNSWLVRIPTDIEPGNYVLRHEVIALHAANQADGAQNYPFCFSLAISSQGTKRPDGVLGTALYSSKDPGVNFSLFVKYSSYPIPGPKLYEGALPVSQVKPGAIAKTGTGVASLDVAALPKPAAPSVVSAVPAVPTPAVPTPAVPSPKTTFMTVQTAGPAKVGPGGPNYVTTVVVKTKITVTSHVQVTVTSMVPYGSHAHR